MFQPTTHKKVVFGDPEYPAHAAHITDLCRRAQCGDVAARDEVIAMHMPLAKSVVNIYRASLGYHLDDALSEASMGLVRALKTYDPNRGLPFGFYATFWAKAYARSCVRDQAHLVRVTSSRAGRTVFGKLGKYVKAIEARGEDASPANIAKEAGTDEDTVYGVMGQMRQPFSLSRQVWTRGGNNGHGLADTYQDLLTDQSQLSPEDEVANEELRARRLDAIEVALTVLTEREREIFVARRLTEDPQTLVALGKRYGFCRERARQIEEKALTKFSKAIKALMTIDDL